MSDASTLLRVTLAGFFGYSLIAMSPVIPFRGRSSVPSLLIGVIAIAVIGFAATFLNWQSGPGTQTGADNSRGNTIQSSPIDVVDGDTVRYNGAVYRLVGFDTQNAAIRRAATMNAAEPRLPPHAYAHSSAAAMPA